MITARSFRHLVRTRGAAAPLPRVLALAVLLFGVLFTHGVNVESVKGHLATSAVAPTATTAEGVGVQIPLLAVTEHGGQTENHPAHSAEHCASGQPYQGSPLTVPCFAASVREAVVSADAGAKRVSGAPERSGAASADLRASVVRQV
ncbi:hypothetical protein [Streptomyces sp. NPDC002845]